MSFELIDKLKAVRDAYEIHPTRDRRNHEADIKSLNNMIIEKLRKLKKEYKKSGNRAMVERCDQELKILMGNRLFEAESLVPSGILDAVPSPLPDPSLSLFAFRGPQPATFVDGFYDRPALNPSVQAVVPAAQLNPAVSHNRRRCSKCGAVGHVQRDCPRNSGGKSRKHNKGRKGRKTRRN